MNIEEWASRVSARLSDSPRLRCETIPLDRLLGQDYDASRSVDLAHQSYSLLLAATASVAANIMARLMFPLRVSDHIDPSPPALTDLQDDLSELEPPILCLCHRSHFQRPSDFEEYRLPLPQKRHTVDTGFVSCYYVCYRDPQAREQGWEYYRAIWFNFYTPELAELPDA